MDSLSRLIWVLSILVLVSLVAEVQAASVTLAWDPSPSQDVAGYKIYYGPFSGIYTNTIGVGKALTGTVSGLLVGVRNYFAITAYDTNGIESDFSNEIGYLNPFLKPVVSLTTPAFGVSYTAPAAISLAAGVSANGHSITKVQFYRGTTLLGEDSTAPYAFSWNNVIAGSYALKARVLYDFGSILDSSLVNVNVTNPLPKVALNAPSNGSSYLAPAVVNLSASVTANGHSITKVQFYNGTNLIGEKGVSPYSVSWSNAVAGSYALRARTVYDGSRFVDSLVVNVGITSPPPKVALNAPASGSSYLAPAVVNLSASVTANGHSITKVQFYNGTNLIGEKGVSPYSVSWSNAVAGSYALKARTVYDVSRFVDSLVVTVGITNPLPKVALTAPANGSSYLTTAVVNLSASVIANGHSITKVQFYNGTNLIGEKGVSPYSVS